MDNMKYRGEFNVDVAKMSMRERLALAANDYTDQALLSELTAWVLVDLERSLEGFDTFAAWKPNPPEERDVDILSALVKNSSLPEDAVLSIIESGWWRVRPKILFHSSISTTQMLSCLQALVGSDSSAIWQGSSFSVAVDNWYYAFGQKRDLRREDWGRVINTAHNIPRLLILVGQKKDLRPQDYVKLAFHPNNLVRQAIAHNHYAPESARVSAALGSRELGI